MNAQINKKLSEEEFQDSAEYNLKYEEDDAHNLLVYRKYIIDFNNDSRIPNYIFHCLTFNQINPDNHEPAKRRNSFFVDDIHKGINSALNIDYKGSGYDRGHMVPAGDFYWNQREKDESFCLTNIAPQTPSLNRGIWNRIENLIRIKTLRDSTDTSIITGCIIISNKTIGINNVRVPDYFYKISFFPKDSTAFSFLLPNSFDRYESNLDIYSVTIDDLERIVQTDFFEKLDDDFEDKLESTKYNINILYEQ